MTDTPPSLPTMTLVRYFPSRACMDGFQYVGLYSSTERAWEGAAKYAKENSIPGYSNMEWCIAQNFEMDEFVVDEQHVGLSL